MSRAWNMSRILRGRGVAQVVIVGAGLTGLATAYHLEQSGFFDFTILEKESEPGGLVRSVQQDGFTFDYTGHLLHVNHPYFKQFIDAIMPRIQLGTCARNAATFSHGAYAPYPFQTNLSTLPLNVICECIEGFVKRELDHPGEPETFYGWATKHFGAGINKHFHHPYNSKLFDLDTKEIHPSWVQHFVPSTTLADILKNLMEQSDSPQTAGYNAIFHYPLRGGIQSFITHLRAKITAQPRLSSAVERIDTTQKQLKMADGSTEHYETLVSTMPLDRLLGSLSKTADSALREQKDNLRCASVFNINLGISIHNLTPHHWIYIPEKKYECYRIGCWSNFSPNMAPDGHSSLYAEFASQPSQSRRAEQASRITRARDDIRNIFGVAEQDIVTEKNLNLEHAYVIYDAWREKHLARLHKALREKNIYSIGRFGEWKYSSMQDAILDGQHAAQDILRHIPHGEKEHGPAQKVLQW
jgi:protoporphyrinogen oxidase